MEELAAARDLVATELSRFDRDHNGTLDRSELAMLFKKLDPQGFPDELVSELVHIVDKNGDGRIKASEFLDWAFGKPKPTLPKHRRYLCLQEGPELAWEALQPRIQQAHQAKHGRSSEFVMCNLSDALLKIQQEEFHLVLVSRLAWLQYVNPQGCSAWRGDTPPTLDEAAESEPRLRELVTKSRRRPIGVVFDPTPAGSMDPTAALLVIEEESGKVEAEARTRRQARLAAEAGNEAAAPVAGEEACQDLTWGEEDFE